jgi:hypothetical protein
VLARGSHLPHSEPVTLVTPPDFDHRQAPESSSKVQEIIEAARSNLCHGEFQELVDLITEYEDIFATGSEEYGRIDRVYHRIDTRDAQPIRQPPRRLPLAKKAEVSGMLDDMKRRGIIEESDSPWSSSFWEGRKIEKSPFFVDYRKLNNVPKKDCFPLPRINDALDMLARAKQFSNPGPKCGYWQVDVHPGDREKTAFSTYQVSDTLAILCHRK